MRGKQQTLVGESAGDEVTAANTGKKSEQGVQGMRREQKTLVGRVNRECKG